MSPDKGGNPAEDVEALLQFLYLSPIGVLRFDYWGRIDMANPAAARLLVPLAPGGAFDDFFELFETVAPELQVMVRKFTASAGMVCDQHRVFLPRGERNHPDMAVTVSIFRVSTGVYMAAVADNMATVRYESVLHSNRERMRAFFESVQDYAMYTIDTSGRVEDWNESIARLAGFAAEDVQSRHFRMFFSTDSFDPATFDGMLDGALKNGWRKMEGWCLFKSGGQFWGDTLITPLRDAQGRHFGFAVVTRNITERKRAEENLQREATTDFLTGLHNRRYFDAAAGHEVARAKRLGVPLSLVCFDIDFFKRVNDTHGHHAGDRVLVALARVAEQYSRVSDILARVGGEEFALLLPGTDADGALVVAEKLRQAVARIGVALEKTTLSITCSFGVSVMTSENGTLENLLARADEALYAAKASGRNCVRQAAAA
jgi:diguanylate cyclase (GGDEF)-like protein/PAS domain S-box-containing protein